jgi:hypothetical protein
LAVHTDVVRAVLVESGYASGTVLAHLQLLRLLDACCVREHVGLAELTDAGIEGLLVGVAAAERPVTLRRLGPVLTGLPAAGVIPASAPIRPDAAGPVGRAICGVPARAAASGSGHGAAPWWLAAPFLRAMAPAHRSGWDIGMPQVADLHGFLFEYASHAAVAGTRMRCFCRI